MDRATSLDAVAMRHELLSTEKNSSFALLNFSVGLRMLGKRSYSARALSLKIERVLSPQSAMVNPKKFCCVMAKESAIAVINVVKPSWRPLRIR